MNRYCFFSLQFACLGVFGLFPSELKAKQIDTNPFYSQDYQTQYFRVQEQELFRLFETRPILVNQATVASITNAPPATIAAIQQHLARNAREIANIFTSLFNPSIGRQIEALLNQSSLINAELINALKANNLILANQLIEQERVNGLQLAEFFGGLFFRIPFPTWKVVCENYSVLTSQETVAYFQNNVVLGETLRNQCIIQFQEIGTLINQALDFQINPNYSSL